MFKGKRWLSVTGLAILTIFLIFMFKKKDSGEFLREQSSNLLSFYTNNLKPLFAGSPISKEDVFNFAFYEELPLDKDNNQYLALGSASGQEYFEFRKSPDAVRTRNLDEFTRKLQLNETEKQQMDSILESYGDQLKDKILVNENNTIAINTNLWNLRKAVLADVMSFAARSNKEFAGLNKNFDQKNSPSFNELIKNVRESNDSNFIFITPDTIFTRKYAVDRVRMREEIAEARRNIRKEQDEALRVKIDFDKEVANLNKESTQRGYKFHMDSNFVRIEVPEVPDIIIPNIEHLLMSVDELTKSMQNFKVNITPPAPKIKNRTHSHQAVPPDPPHTDYELNIDIPNVDSLVLESLKGTRLLDTQYWEEFGRRMDSLGRKYDQAGEKFDTVKFKREMKKLQRDLEKLKSRKRTSVEVK